MIWHSHCLTVYRSLLVASNFSSEFTVDEITVFPAARTHLVPITHILSHSIPSEVPKNISKQFQQAESQWILFLSKCWLGCFVYLAPIDPDNISEPIDLGKSQQLGSHSLVRKQTGWWFSTIPSGDQKPSVLVDGKVRTRWCPPVISWFINPINYSYKYDKP